MWVIRTGIHKKVVEIANKEDPDQAALFIWDFFFGWQLLFEILKKVLQFVRSDKTALLYYYI